MELKCPNCGDNMDSRTANVQTDLIQCANCFKIHQLSELVVGEEYEELESRELMPREERLPAAFNKLNRLSKPLQGSRINSYFSKSGLDLEIPPRAIQGTDWFLVLFSVFWLGFVAFWTVMASQGSVFFALFSVPFWYVGIMMAKGVLTSLTQKQHIYMDKYTLRVKKQGLLTTSVKEFNIEDIDSITMKEKDIKNQGFKAFSNISQATSGSSTMLLPTVTVGVDETKILENALELEQVWAVELLEKALAYFNK